jgi:hypothetical protein
MYVIIKLTLFKKGFGKAFSSSKKATMGPSLTRRSKKLSRGEAPKARGPWDEPTHLDTSGEKSTTANHLSGVIPLGNFPSFKKISYKFKFYFK